MKNGARILVIDDEIEIVRILKRGLTAQGYQVFVAATGEEGIAHFWQHHPDLILLDLMLPDKSGLEICREVREQSQLPILILSAKDAESDKVRALDLGADDYIPKPFGMPEVLARIRVALRHVARTQSGTGTHIWVGPLGIDIARRQVLVRGNEIELTPTEYDLLYALVSQAGKVLTRQMLLHQVWGNDAVISTHSLHVYIGQLRRKIELDAAHPRLIRTIPGVGYRFNEEEEAHIAEPPLRMA